MENLVKRHKELFGVDPIFIGLFWDDTEKQFDGVSDAIDNGVPYDEYKMLSKSDQEAYDNGDLLF